MATSSDFLDGEHFVVRYTRDGEVRQTAYPVTEDEALEKALALTDRGLHDAHVVDLLDV
jgi:hypothetical protein